MPNYEYQCIACAHKFELWQTVGSAAPACEECGEEVKKVFHVPRVIFKGSGFYVTDLRAEKEGAKSKSETKAEPKSEDAGAAKTESAPASSETKTETASSTASAASTPTTSSAPAGGK